MFRPGTILDLPFEALGVVIRAVQRREDRRIEADLQVIADIASGHWMKED